MTLEKINLNDIDSTHCRVVLDKACRVVQMNQPSRIVTHGRQVIHDEEKDLYYKIFDDDYCRRENFERALHMGFFDGLAPALHSVIVHPELNDEIVGYATEAGTPLGSEFDEIPREFFEKVLDKVKETKMLFYYLVPVNIIKTKNGELSLIDLESVYDLYELHNINKHNAKVKPDYYYKELEELWEVNEKVISFIQPSRNNLKYLKWSYNSIRKNLGYRHEICWADDFSDDGTWEWMKEIKDKDPNVKIHRNEGPTRLGHTIL